MDPHYFETDARIPGRVYFVIEKPKKKKKGRRKVTELQQFPKMIFHLHIIHNCFPP